MLLELGIESMLHSLLETSNTETGIYQT